MANVITAQEAVEAMFSFVRKNLNGLEDVREEKNYFYGRRQGKDFVLRVTDRSIRPSQSFLDEVAENSVQGIATALLMLRSTIQYDGKLLRQLEYWVDEKNLVWKNKKKISQFERDVLSLYGNRAVYYNPQINSIQIISAKRYREIAEHVASRTPEELERDKQLRRELHIEEKKRTWWRKIWIREEIKGPFTLEAYERTNKPLVAKVVAYQPQ